VSFFQVGYTGTTAVLSGYVDSFFQWHWFNFGNASVILSFKISELETIMFGVVLLITCLVLLYSVDYMGNDPRRKFFLSHIIIFSIFMCIFIASNDLITVFIGWEGVGLSSFFLINFWFTRIQANKAAFKAILVNKIGDSALLIAIAVSVFV
jgi:NADH:ubiquinone oxidoreductase subunit 5 (subunit L)/multisubunit Na+/H+ antiporter MnhA subunit